MAQPIDPRSSSDTSSDPVKGRDETRRDADSLDAFYAELEPLQRGTPQQMAEAVLCELARSLDDSEVRKLQRQLPRGVASLLPVCDRHAGAAPARRRDRDTFFADVADDLGTPGDQAFRVVTGVFTAVRDRLPDEEVHAVASQLPSELADLFRRPL